MDTLTTYRDAVLGGVPLLLIFGIALHWVLWLLGLGRFKGPQTESKLRFVLADFVVKIIDDFRHLLALLVIVLFAVALFAAMWPGMMKQDVKLIQQGLQSVAATLSGLIGSIIGYYFGESAAKGRTPGGTVSLPPSDKQGPPQGGPEIEAPAKPPKK